MQVFCPRGHNQSRLPAMGGLCEICITTHPDEFKCKDPNCPHQKGDEPHFHPDERSYFVDEKGNRIGA